MKEFKNFRAYFYLVISSALAALSFAPWKIWPLGFIALWPVFYLLETERLTLRRAFSWFVVWALSVNLLGYHWLVHTIEIHGHLPLLAAIPVFILYSLGTGTRFLIYFVLNLFWREKIQHIPVHPRWRKLAELNLLRQTFFWGMAELASWQLFPWYGANLVSADLLFVQAADIFGTRGLSLLWFAISFSFYEAIIDKMREQDGVLRKLLPGLLLFIVFHGYGLVRYQIETARIAEAEKLRVVVPQGNTPLSFSHLRNARSALYEAVTAMVDQTIRIVEQERQAGREVDLVVWPESATPFLSLQRSSFLRSEVNRMLQHIQLPVVINDILNDDSADKNYSNMSLLSKEGEVVENYQKVFLLPFGEFMPLANTFPWLKNAFPEISDFSHGTRFALFPHEKAYLLPVICYEIIPSGFVRDFFNRTGKKATVIVNITNDAWFGRSIESYQHMELGRMRSIELRLPTVRATNSGVSALIDSAGRISGETPLFEKADRVYEVPLVKLPPTIYARLGELWYYLGLVALALALTVPRLRVGR